MAKFPPPSRQAKIIRSLGKPEPTKVELAALVRDVAALKERLAG
jgi:hypothetical protein